MTRIIIKQGDWTTKKLSVKDATFRMLSTGKRIDTASKMLRLASKIK